MKLTTQTDYALRTLMFLATRRRRATAEEVATLFGISVHHVKKVANLLTRHGYVRSIRGIGGGLELARPADAISIGEVVLAMEGNLHLLDCIGTDDVCVIESFCKLKSALAEAERVQVEYLESVTLSDVVPTKRQLDRVELAST